MPNNKSNGFKLKPQQKYGYENLKYNRLGLVKKDSAFMANYKNYLGGNSPMVVSTGDFIGSLKNTYQAKLKNKIDTVYYKDLKGPRMLIRQGGTYGKVISNERIDKIPVKNKKPKKGGM